MSDEKKNRQIRGVTNAPNVSTAFRRRVARTVLADPRLIEAFVAEVADVSTGTVGNVMGLYPELRELRATQETTLSNAKREVIDYAAANDYDTEKEIAEAVGRSPSTVYATFSEFPDYIQDGFEDTIRRRILETPDPAQELDDPFDAAADFSEETGTVEACDECDEETPVRAVGGRDLCVSCEQDAVDALERDRYAATTDSYDDRVQDRLNRVEQRLSATADGGGEATISLPVADRSADLDHSRIITKLGKSSLIRPYLRAVLGLPEKDAPSSDRTASEQRANVEDSVEVVEKANAEQ
jgi:hypothetical protein